MTPRLKTYEKQNVLNLMSKLNLKINMKCLKLIRLF